MMPVVLYRKVSAPADDEAELQAIAAAGLPVVFNRAAIPPDSLVICRYSCLPFYRELEKDIVQLGSRLINSFRLSPWTVMTLPSESTIPISFCRCSLASICKSMWRAPRSLRVCVWITPRRLPLNMVKPQMTRTIVFMTLLLP